MAASSRTLKPSAIFKLPWLLISPAKMGLAIIVVFFVFQAFTGKQGLLSWRQYAIEAEALEIQKAELLQRKTHLQDAVSRLSSARADSDFIEERAIRDMNMADPRDIEIKIPTPPPELATN
ncbi:MAG: septum formation initiator family protein [Pseudomonadota bacterium]